MSEQQIDVVRSLYAAFGRGDLEGILAPLDPQVSWRTPGAPDLPTAGLRQGIPAVREFFGLLLSTFDIADFQPRDFLAAGDKVVVLGTSREGPKGSGRLVDFRWVHVFTFKNGFERRSTIRAGNRVLYVAGNFGRTEQLDLANVTLIEFE